MADANTNPSSSPSLVDRLARVKTLAPAGKVARYREPLSQLPPPAFLRIYVTSHCRGMLHALSERKGVCTATIIARALDQYLRRELSLLTLANSKCEEDAHE